MLYLALVLLMLAWTTESRATCVPFPCLSCGIESIAQSNLVIMERQQDTVALVPNIVISGQAEDFALVVPTPSLPHLPFETVDAAVWRDLSRLTSAVRRPTGGSCSDGVFSPSALSSGPSGVDVHARDVVGSFLMTVISSDNTTALVTWLRDNGFEIDVDEEALFAPYVQQGWYFSAMRLNPDDPANRLPVGGWRRGVDPVLIRFDADRFEVPIPLLSINRAPTMPMVFYVVDQSRVDLEGYDTWYANDVNQDEARAIAERHPSLAPFIQDGRTLTRLQKIYTLSDPMRSALWLEEASESGEFRRGWKAAQAPPGVVRLDRGGCMLGLAPGSKAGACRTPAMRFRGCRPGHPGRR